MTSLPTFGETMAVFTTPGGRLRHAATVTVSIAGAGVLHLTGT